MAKKNDTPKIGNNYRLYPNKMQMEFIDKCIESSACCWNWALHNYKNGKSVEEIALKLKNEFYEQHPEYSKDVVDASNLHYQVQILRNCNGNKKRLKYKKRGLNSGSYHTKINNPLKKINTSEGYVKLPIIGCVKCVFHRDIRGRFENLNQQYVTISKNSIGEYYISFPTGIDLPKQTDKPATEENTIGVDLGVKNFAILNDGTKFEKIEIDKKLDKRKKHLQCLLSKKTPGSKNYKKLQQKISKIDLIIARRRENYQYHVAQQILSRDGIENVIIEDLNTKGMSSTGKSKTKLTAEQYNQLSDEEKKKYNRKKRKGFNRSILNQGFYSFGVKLENKCKEKGNRLKKINRFSPSSQKCSNCGYINRDVKKLSVRVWECPICGHIHDRDINAAINIRNEGINMINNDEKTSQKNLGRCNPEVKSAENNNRLNDLGTVTQVFNEPEKHFKCSASSIESE